MLLLKKNYGTSIFIEFIYSVSFIQITPNKLLAQDFLKAARYLIDLMCELIDAVGPFGLLYGRRDICEETVQAIVVKQLKEQGGGIQR